MNIFKNKKFKYGGMSILITIIFIVAVIMFNIIFNSIMSRIPNLDLTTEKLYSLDEKTIEYIKNIKDDITITILADEADYKTSDLYNTLKNYELYSNKIEMNFIDLIKNPEFTSKYKETLNSGDVIIENKRLERHRVQTSNDFYNVTYDQYYTSVTDASFIGEEVLTSAIMYVTDENPVSITIVSGHEETENTGFETLLEKNGYIIEHINLLTENINTESEFIIITAPKYDYDDATIDKLEAFLDNNGQFGKTLMYIGSHSQMETPKLDNFLAEWGIQVGSGVIYQTDTSYVTMYQTYQIEQLTDNDYTAKLSNPDLYMFVVNSRPIYTLFTESGNMTTNVLLKSYPGAVIMPVDDENWTPESAGQMGEYNSIVESSKVKYEGTTPFTSRVIAFGSLEMFDSYILEQQNFNNAEFFVNMYNIISGKEDGITITPKNLIQPLLEITVKTKDALGIVFALVIPVLILAVGVIIWLRRRHL